MKNGQRRAEAVMQESEVVSCTSLITGVASAYADRIPMLVITPQTALPHFGRHGLQDSSGDAIGVVEMFATCTRYNTSYHIKSSLKASCLRPSTPHLETLVGRFI